MTETLNLWDTMLRQAAQRHKLQESSIIFLGEKESGKRSLIGTLQKGPASLSHLHGFTNLIPEGQVGSPSSALDYSYINVKDPRDPQSDKLTRCNIWFLDDDKQKNLLKLAVKIHLIEKTTLMIGVDLSKPSLVMKNIQKWLEIWHQFLSDNVFKNLDQKQQEQMIKRNEQFIRTYSVPEFDEDGRLLQIQKEIIEDMPLQEGVLETNFGIPIIIVGLKSDILWHIDKQVEQAEYKLDVMQIALRKICLKYGASLVYTSTKQNFNISNLYAYLMHRLYSFSFGLKPEITERDSIFIPAGWDSNNLIQELSKSTFTVKEPQNPEENRNVFEVYDQLFANSNSQKMQIEQIEVEDFQQFLTSAKQILEQKVKAKKMNPQKKTDPSMYKTYQPPQLNVGSEQEQVNQAPSITPNLTKITSSESPSKTQVANATTSLQSFYDKISRIGGNRAEFRKKK